MKKLLSSVMLFSAIAFTASAQTTGTVEGPTGLIPEKASDIKKVQEKHPWVFGEFNTTTPKAKRDEVSAWYSYVDAAAQAGVDWDLFRAPLFPDSTVLVQYSDGNNGLILGNVNLNNIGQTFDPKYEFFSDALTRHNPYRCDSVAFLYRYAHNVPGSVDTIRIQFYENARVQAVQFGTDGRSHSVSYDWMTNRTTGTAFSREVEIYLTEDDTTGDASAWYSVAVPGGGMNVNANSLCAFTMTYHPGYDYEFGDTLQYNWEETEVVKKLNLFHVITAHDAQKFPEETSNDGLLIYTSQRYNLTINGTAGGGWPGRFVPGRAFNNADQNLYAQFYIYSDNVSVDKLENGYGLGNAYPNPATANSTLNVDFALGNAENVTIELYNATGVKVATAIDNQNFAAGENTASFNLNVAPGIYFYTIKAGAYSATKKLIVQ